MFRMLFGYCSGHEIGKASYAPDKSARNGGTRMLSFRKICVTDAAYSLCFTITMLALQSSISAHAQQYKAWNTENVREILEARERLERGDLYPVARGIEIGRMFRPAKRERPNLSGNKTGVSPEFAQKVLADFRKFISPRYLPESLIPFLENFREERIVVGHGQYRPNAAVAYTLRLDGEEYLVQLIWTEHTVRGFITCPLQAVSPSAIEVAASRLFVMPPSNGRVRRDTLRNTAEAHDEAFNIFREGPPRRADLVFPRTIQIDYRQMGLVIRGGVCPLRMKEGEEVKDYTAIAFLFLKKATSWRTPQESSYEEE